jgi:hypothetical protein
MLKELGIRTGKSLPQNLLDAAAVNEPRMDEPKLALAAEAAPIGDSTATADIR